MTARRLARRGAAAALAGILAAVPPAAAEVTVLFAEGDAPLFSVVVPDGWTLAAGEPFAETGAPRVLSLHPEGDLSLWVGFMAPSGLVTEADALDWLAALAPRLADGAAAERAGPAEVAGVDGFTVAGSGTRGGAPVDFAAFGAPLPAGGWALALFVGENGAKEAYAEALEGLGASFRLLPAEAGR